MKNKAHQPYKDLQLPSFCLKQAKYQKMTVIFAFLHLCCIFSFIAGLYGIKLYMNSPNKVIIQNNCGTVQRGYITTLNTKEIYLETAIRSTLAMLSYNPLESFEDEQKLNSILGKTAKKQFFEFLSTFDKKFKELKITQYVQINDIAIKKTSNKDQVLVYVFGILHRTGYYHEILNYQKLNFTLGLRLARNNKITEYPYKVLRFIYKEKSIYQDTPLKEIKK